jgi:hypothetical protein
VAHFFAVPLLATPATAFGVNDAGAGAAAAWVIVHSQLLGFKSMGLALQFSSLRERPPGGQAGIEGKHLRLSRARRYPSSKR